MGNRAIGCKHTRPRHGRVGFALDALIPVVERRSARFGVYFSSPGILARGLVEMAMYDNGSHRLSVALNESRMFGKIASRTSSSFASFRAFSRSASLPLSPRIRLSQSEMCSLILASA